MSLLVLTTPTNPGTSSWTNSALLPTSSAFMAVATLVDRDAIDPSLRIVGMWVSVAETGVVYYLDAGLTNADWAVVDLSRPLLDTVPAVSVFVDGAAGSDKNGTGTALLPFQTITRAIQQLGSVPASNRTINIVGTSVWPGSLSNLNLLNFQGATPTISETGTIASVTSASDTAGIVLNLTGLNPVLINSLKGTAIRWTSGPASGRRGWIYRNDATGAYVPGETRIYVSQNSQGVIIAPVAGNTLNLESLPSTIQFPSGSSSLSDSFGAKFTDLQLDVVPPGASSLSLAATGQVEFVNCRINATFRVVVGSLGRGFLHNTYVRNSVASGMYQVGVGGIGATGWGTVFDGVSAGAGNFISATSGQLNYVGQTVFTSMNNVRVDGSNVNFVFSTVANQLRDHFFFDSTSAGIVFNSAVGLLRGGQGRLPNLFGTVASAYCVTAQGGANIALGVASAVTTALGTNTVSADNGVSGVAQAADGTLIQGGSPSISPLPLFGTTALNLATVGLSTVAVNVAVTGALVGDIVSLGLTAAIVHPDLIYYGYVSAAGVLTVVIRSLVAAPQAVLGSCSFQVTRP